MKDAEVVERPKGANGGLEDELVERARRWFRWVVPTLKPDGSATLTVRVQVRSSIVAVVIEESRNEEGDPPKG